MGDALVRDDGAGVEPAAAVGAVILPYKDTSSVDRFAAGLPTAALA